MEKKRNKPNMSSARRPSLEETTLLFAGTISLVICPGDGPTEGRHKKPRQEEGRNKELIAQKKQSYVQLVGQARHKTQKKGQR